jgi:hypothetical protein
MNSPLDVRVLSQDASAAPACGVPAPDYAFERVRAYALLLGAAEPELLAARALAWAGARAPTSGSLLEHAMQALSDACPATGTLPFMAPAAAGGGVSTPEPVPPILLGHMAPEGFEHRHPQLAVPNWGPHRSRRLLGAGILASTK